MSTTAARNGSIGLHGERVAARHLVERGLEVLDRRWRCPEGEVDLVLVDGPVLVVCEVKTRTSTRHGHPLEAVTPAKLERLHRLGQRWCEEHGRRFEHVRVDVVSVLLARRGAARVEHVPGVG